MYNEFEKKAILGALAGAAGKLFGRTGGVISKKTISSGPGLLQRAKRSFRGRRSLVKKIKRFLKSEYDITAKNIGEGWRKGQASGARSRAEAAKIKAMKNAEKLQNEKMYNKSNISGDDVRKAHNIKKDKIIHAEFKRNENKQFKKQMKEQKKNMTQQAKDEVKAVSNTEIPTNTVNKPDFLKEHGRDLAIGGGAALGGYLLGD